MPRCKPGQLAFISKDWHSDNIGRIVEVLGVARPSVWHDPSLGVYQRVRSASPLWVLSHQSDGTTDENLRPPGHECQHPDAWLRPINDPDIDLSGDDPYANVPTPLTVAPRIEQPEEIHA